MVFPRDIVLEGVRPADVEALASLSADPAHPLDSSVLRRLEAKGWVDTYGEINIVTVVGRVLLDAH
jgi:hypothetical protein